MSCQTAFPSLFIIHFNGFKLTLKVITHLLIHLFIIHSSIPRFHICIIHLKSLCLKLILLWRKKQTLNSVVWTHLSKHCCVIFLSAFLKIYSTSCSSTTKAAFRFYLFILCYIKTNHTSSIYFPLFWDIVKICVFSQEVS